VDNVTHTLLGVALANAGLARRFGRGTTLALAVASNLPDVDGCCLFLDDGILLRRTLTHSVFGILALSAIAATAFRWKYRDMPWKIAFGLFLLGSSFHVFLDLLNSFGVLLFHPVSHERFELGWVFIIDLILAAILLAPLVLAKWFDRGKASRIALVAAGVYLALCGVSRTIADQVLHRAAPQAEFAYVFPEPLGPHRFRGVALKNGAYDVYLIETLTGEIERRRTVPTDLTSPRVVTARRTERAKRLEAFLKAPVWRVDGDEVEVSDLRFQTLVVPRDPSTFRFRFKP
jgi:inner membrane protein